MADRRPWSLLRDRPDTDLRVVAIEDAVQQLRCALFGLVDAAGSEWPAELRERVAGIVRDALARVVVR